MITSYSLVVQVVGSKQQRLRMRITTKSFYKCSNGLEHSKFSIWCDQHAYCLMQNFLEPATLTTWPVWCHTSVLYCSLPSYTNESDTRPAAGFNEILRLQRMLRYCQLFVNLESVFAVWLWYRDPSGIKSM